jgi:pimeloyl-ACP methyl ester carboxylesterase
MAEDTAALLKKLNITNADLVGWSDGGQLALRVVASGVGLGANAEISKELNAEKDFGKLAAGMFPAGPAYWPVYAEIGKVMWSGVTWGFTLKDLGKIQRPVLIVAGDADVMPLDETTRIFRAIPKAKLYILPGTGHTTFQDRPEWLNPVVLNFLDQN